ncbi:MAG: hypothetical protein JWM10_5054 [Myxococcaceae bacterium]|nr:hypothetical protein [Myxococcaceae bacterium]
MNESGMVRSLTIVGLLASAGCGRRDELPPVVAPTGTLARPVVAPVVPASPTVRTPPVARPTAAPPATTPVAPEPETTGRVLVSTRPASNCTLSNGVQFLTPRLLFLPPAVYQMVCENATTGQRREFQGIAVRAGAITLLRNQSLDSPDPTGSTAQTRTPIEDSPPMAGGSVPEPTTPMEQARACLRLNSVTLGNVCVVQVLRGRASTEPELWLLAATYRALGRTSDATRAMRTYIQRYPDGLRVARFQQYIDYNRGPLGARDPCAVHTDCSSCSRADGCGWCNVPSACLRMMVDGNEPVSPTCQSGWVGNSDICRY